MYYFFLNYLTFCCSNSERMFCCRHYREVEIPLRQSQHVVEESGTGKPGTSQDGGAFSRYESDAGIHKQDWKGVLQFGVH